MNIEEDIRFMQSAIALYVFTELTIVIIYVETKHERFRYWKACLQVSVAIKAIGLMLWYCNLGWRRETLNWILGVTTFIMTHLFPKNNEQREHRKIVVNELCPIYISFNYLLSHYSRRGF